MRKSEAYYQSIWSRYVAEKMKEGFFFYYELKQSRTEKFWMWAFEDHQIPWLLARQENGYHHKASDADPRQKGCDGWSSPPNPAYVVIRYPKAFVMINVHLFVAERDDGGSRNLSYARACEIAHKVIFA